MSKNYSFVSYICVFCLAVAVATYVFTISSPHLKHPVKEFTIDGCDVYSFNLHGDTNYFARCDNGKVATTYDGDKHIITEPK